MSQQSTLMPDISVSIVSYNTRDLLRACLQALRERAESGEVTLEIIVADNASRDGSADMVEREFPAVKLIRTGGNLGYGRANNKALAQARGRYFFVLNSDTEVLPGALSTLRDWMDAHPNVGVAGAQLMMPDGRPQDSCAGDPTLLAFVWEQTYLNKLLPESVITGAYNKTYLDLTKEREVEQVVGACMCVRREAWQQVGGFDPTYFMYFEDTDLCMRLRREGWPIYFVPQARILHQLGASSRDWQSRARMVAAYNHSRYYYFHRYHGARTARAFKVLLLLGALLRLSIGMAGAWFRPGAREKIRIFRRVLRRTWQMKPDAANGDTPEGLRP
jgi:GT2 family glycosyltransferase